MQTRCLPRENPFRASQIERIKYRFEDFDWHILEERLDTADRRGAVVGPQGYGKTTLLLEWCSRVRNRGEGATFLRLHPNSWQREVAEADLETDWIFIDGAEVIGFFGWRRLLQRVPRPSRLVVSQHRTGRLPTIWLCRTSPELLRVLVNELTTACPAPPDIDFEQLWSRNFGNIRLSLRELYDWKQADSANRAEIHRELRFSRACKMDRG